MKRIALIILLLTSYAAATSYPEWNVETLYTRADIVAVGEVGAHETTVDGTTTPLENVTMFTGDEQALHLQWHTADTIAGLPVPNPGATVLVFAYDGAGGVSPVVGFASGLFTLDRNGFRNSAGQWLGISDNGELYLGTRSNAAPSDSVLQALTNPTFAEAPAAEPTQPGDEAEIAELSDEAEPADVGEARTFSLSISSELAANNTFTAALAAWNEALAPHRIEATTSEDPHVRVGDPRRLGDAISLTVQHDGALYSEIRVRASEALVFNAALQAIALQLGAAEANNAVVAPLLPSTKRMLSAADVATVLRAEPAIVGDINQDGVVDFEDLLRLAAKFGETGINLPEDINNDGLVDEADLAIMKEQYTFTEPQRR